MASRLADLTLPIEPGMLSNPDHFPPEITLYATLERDGWTARRLVLDSHLGTHLDAPSHFVAGAPDVDQADLEVLIGTAEVIHLSGIEPGEVITAARLGPVTGRRVLLDTGWGGRGLAQAEYFGQAPYLAPDAAEALLAAGTELLGVDLPSVDLDGGVHVALLGAGCLIVENLTGLAALPGRCELTVLPLPITGGDGSPVRAVARFEADDNEGAGQPR
ncbi:MAG: cyclase family protein [Actinobacteria bacterium]|nr:cyclase family protein [Actinomycetota bacterium]